MDIKTINSSLPADLLKIIDRKAKEKHSSRSELLKEAIVTYIQTRDNWKVLQQDLSAKARGLNIKSEQDVEGLVDLLRR